MLEIDGSGGGGQQLRTALALSMLTGEPFRVENVRGGRSNPGLRNQHLTGVELAADVSDATVEGASLGSETVTFHPGELQGGHYDVDVGTAGSLTLLFETVLPLATRLDDPLTVTAVGGTDVKWSPPFAYLQEVKLPLLERFGLDASVTLDRTGFYPAGGGRATLELSPSELRPLDLTERGDLERVTIFSKASESLGERQVAERQAAKAADGLQRAGLPVGTRNLVYHDTASPGSSLVLVAVYERALAGFDRLGEKGLPAEAVADEAVGNLRSFHQSGGVVGPHMADQVMPFLALAGGRVRIPRVTEHVETNRETITAFGYEVDVEESDDSAVLSADSPE